MTNRDFDPVTDYHQQQYQQNPNATVSILSDQDILLKLKNQNKLPYINTSNYGTSIHSDHSSESGSSITGSSNMFEGSPTHSHPTASSQSLDGSHTTCSQHSEWTSENGSQIYSYSKEDKNQS